MLTVSLMVSGCTISLIPLDRFVTNGFNVVAGTGNFPTIFFAQGGRFTSALAEETNDSPPPKLFPEIGLSDGVGVRIAEIAWSKSRYFLATRFTSSTVTARNELMSSSGELRPSPATAVDHAEARPETEFFCSSALMI